MSDFRERAREAYDYLNSGLTEEESVDYLNSLFAEFYQAGSVDEFFDGWDEYENFYGDEN